MASWSSDRGRRRSRRSAAPSGLLAALLAIGGASGCTSLGDVQENICGNHVLEAGEACDFEGVQTDEFGKKSICGAPRSDGECHFLCNDSAGNESCPDNSTCAPDGVCRKPSGTFAAAQLVAEGSSRRLSKGDFDGDGRSDVVAVGDASLSIHYFEKTGARASTIGMAIGPVLPAIGNLTASDATDDLMLGLDGALGVLLGQSDRTLSPKNYTSASLSAGTKKVIPLGSLGNKGAYLLAFVEIDGQTRMERQKVEVGTTTAVDILGPALPGTLAGAVAVSRQSPSACPIVAFELSGPPGTPSALHAFTCEAGSDDFLILKDVELHDFDGGKTAWAGAFLADMNGDGKLDVVNGREGGKHALGFHAGDGQGGFDTTFVEVLNDGSDPCNGNGGSATAALTGVPLAVGQLDDNGLADIVDSRGVIFDAGENAHRGGCLQGQWSSAVIADFDANGHADLLAARRGPLLLDLFRGAGDGTFNASTIATSTPIDGLVAGDFDGDGVADAVLQDDPLMSSGSSTTTPIELEVIFGRSHDQPESAVSLGSFDGPVQLATGSFMGTNALSSDALSDIIVMQGNPEDALALIPGSVTRQLLVPFVFHHEGVDNNAPATPKSIVAGKFYDRSDCTNRTRLDVAAFDDTTRKLWLASGCDDADLATVPFANDVIPDSSQELLLLVPLSMDAKTTSQLAQHVELVAFLVATAGASGDVQQERDVTAVANIQFDKNDGHALPPTVIEIPQDMKLRTFALDSAQIPVRVADIDGNDFEDIVMASLTGDIFVFQNSGTSPPIDPSKYLRFTLQTTAQDGGSPDPMGHMGDGRVVEDIAVANVDDDPEIEIIVLARGQLYVTDKNGTLTASDDVKLFVKDGDSILKSAFVKDGDRNVLGADVNGDGVDDLLLSGSSGLRLFLGKEGVP